MSGQVLGAWVQNASFLGAAAALVLFLGFYTLFALGVVRQALLLNSLLKTKLALLIQLLSLAHFLFGAVVFVFSLFYFQNIWREFFELLWRRF